MSKRERCTITKAEVQYDPDRGCWTCYVLTDTGQAFCPTFVDSESANDVAKHVAAVFGVTSLSDIAGKGGWVLRPFGYLNDMIEGLEANDGKRFTLTNWQRKRDPAAPSRLDRERCNIETEIRWARRRLREAEERLETVDAEYTEWSEAEQ